MPNLAFILAPIKRCSLHLFIASFSLVTILITLVVHQLAGKSTPDYLPIITKFPSSLTAIMLSRLRMSVDDTITEYKYMAETIFGRPRSKLVRMAFKSSNKYSTQKLEACIRDVLARRAEPVEREIFFHSPPDLCKGY